jgi:uncharacterized protein (DUF1697 family)
MNPVPDRLVALLRGINVGGNKPIDMSRLRHILTNLGHSDVGTYLQSGNAVFTSTAGPADAASTLEDAIAGELGVDCRVIVRTAAQLSAIIAADPLLHLVNNPSRHFVAFPDRPPRPQGVTSLSKDDYGTDQLRVVDGHVYLWCPDGISKSPFARINFDRTLDAAITMRNWNTVTKLAELAG